MIPKLIVTISKTTDGQSEYLQIMHADLMTVNIVLIASQIEIRDARKKQSKTVKR